MEENIKFQSVFTYDLEAHKEYNKLLNHAMGRNSILRAISSVCIVYLLLGFQSRFSILMFLGLTVFYAAVNLIPLWRNRDGGLVYKQVLHQNGGQAPQHIVTFTEEGVRSTNPLRDNFVEDSYADVRYLMESEHLLILVTELKMCHIIDKRNLEGGSCQELVAHLRTVCPKLKKKVRKGRFGKIITWFMWIMLALGAVIGICRLTQLPARLSGQLTNDMSYEEMAAELAPLGIHISQQAIQELKEYDAQYAAEHGEYYAQNTTANKVADLLYWEGCGIYDQETWEWTPSESGVYWFDLEVMDCASIYTDFLRGLDAMDESLTFSGVTEDYSQVDMETGTGIVTFSFDYLGNRRTFNAQYESDWFDTNMLTHMGRILQQDSDPKDLWYTFDGQGVLLYYGTQEEARALEQKTGLYFLDPVNQQLYGY